MIFARYGTILLARIDLPLVIALMVLFGGVTASSCQRQEERPSADAMVKDSSAILPSSTKPMIPAPELTTLAPAPSSSPAGEPKSKPTPNNTQRSTAKHPSVATGKPSTSQVQKITALPVPPRPTTGSPRVPIRVAIAQQAPSLVIGASTSAQILDQQGQLVTTLQAATAEKFEFQGGQIHVGSKTAPPIVWIKPESATGQIYVSGRWYRGEVQVIANQGHLLGINHVDMESYLYSVVGSEMPASWPLEALKSQAIAARSYALVHIARPFNPLYDLGDTPRWQAYTGVKAETHTTLAAVEATAGLVLSHNGSVVESLYAASDDIVRDVHKGFGMSQNGANQLAQKQYSFQQILAHFYPGTRLAWLQIAS